MAKVAVLHPQNLFNYHSNSLIGQAVKSQPSRRHNNRYSSPFPCRKKNPAKDPIPAKETTKPRPRPTAPSITKNTSNNLVMGQFKLLKRGQTLPLPLSSRPPSSKVDSTPPKNVQKTKQATLGKKKRGSLVAGVFEELSPQQVRFLDRDCYAGSAVVSSPPPSSLPFPRFLKKKNLGNDRSNSTTPLPFIRSSF